MRLSKKKIAVFLLATVLCSSGTFVYSSQFGENEGTKSLFGNSGSTYVNDPNFTAGLNNGSSTGKVFFRMTLMVLLVVVLGAAAIYLSKKLLPRLTHLSGKQIRIIETVHLGPRKAVHLLKIGDKQILIGSTNENITKLADVMVESSGADSPTDQIDNDLGLQ